MNLGTVVALIKALGGSSGGGGGGGTLIANNTVNNGNTTLDKTLQEIVDAQDDGKVVESVFTFSDGKTVGYLAGWMIDEGMYTYDVDFFFPVLQGHSNLLLTYSSDGMSGNPTAVMPN